MRLALLLAASVALAAPASAACMKPEQLAKLSGEQAFKQTPGDFQVIEELGFALTGSGEHACLRIRKTGVTTQDVVLMNKAVDIDRRSPARVAAAFLTAKGLD